LKNENDEVIQVGDSENWLRLERFESTFASVFAGSRISIISICVPSKVSVRNYQIFCGYYFIVKLLHDIRVPPSQPSQLKSFITPKELL
jgi:hypothetical protein